MTWRLKYEISSGKRWLKHSMRFRSKLDAEYARHDLKRIYFCNANGDGCTKAKIRNIQLRKI